MTEREQTTDPNQEIFQRRPRPEKDGKEKIIIGYIFCLFGGLFGAFIGLQLYYAKRTLANGEEAHAYTQRARQHGKNIIFLAIAFTILWVLFQFYKEDIIYQFG